MVLAHAGRPLQPHDLAGAWNLDPLLLAGLALAGWAYTRGREPAGRRRTAAFAGALAVLAVALVSPLDALSGALASAHMVQHVLLVLVAAPLLAYAAPSSAVLRGSPAALRRGAVRLRDVLGVRRVDSWRHPVVVWLAHVAALWLWHAAVLYDAALRLEWVHALEHATFLVTAVLLWRVVVSARRGVAVSQGAGILIVFGTAMQSVFLSVLMVFASSPWYAGYAATTESWGLGHLADQQLAGAIMWVPAGAVYVVVALALLVAWLQAAEATERPSTAAVRG